MFERLFRRPYYINRHINAPFLQERIKYIQLRDERGCAIQSLRDTAQYLLRIIEFLNLKSKVTVTFEEIEQAADKWARYQSNHPQKQRPFSLHAKVLFTCHSINFLKMINRLLLPGDNSSLLIKIFDREKAIKRHFNAPLLNERLLYLKYWAENGAKIHTLKNTGQYMLIVMKYLNFYKIRTITKNEIKKSANRWARSINIKNKKNDYSKFSKDRFIRIALGWFEMLECLEKPIKKHFLFEEYLDSYINYMRQEQGLSENTIQSRYLLLKDFLINLKAKIKNINKLTPLIVDKILIKKYDKDGYSRRTIQSYASVIRSFLRFAENQNWCQRNLASSIKAPRVYRHESLPYSPSWDNVKKILKDSETNKATDIRDRPILMLLSIYGIRCSEVRHLKLEDIDWQNELLHLERAKRSKSQTFPLLKSVGNAILRYLKKVRSIDCTCREVFLCMRAPYRPLSSSAVFQIVNRKLKPLNLTIKHQGPHALRHACATHLINDGISLKQISDHLGHQGLETTRLYAKVDLKNLRKVSEFDMRDLL